MKNLNFYCFLLVCLSTGSCKNTKNSETTVKNEELIHSQCYKALYEQDTLDLKNNTLKDRKIIWSMEMIVLNMPKMVGEIAGEFRGDTLFTSYTYIEGGNKKIIYKNPMAFLKRGNEIILGNLVTEAVLGASYIAEGKPIDFDQVKYKFTTVDCVGK